MFELKQGKYQELYIGSAVDVVEFAKRYSCLHEAQKEILKYGSYIGNIDEYALELGYACPASSPFRKDLQKLVDMGLVAIADYDDDYAKTHDFSWRSETINKRTKMFLVADHWICEILKIDRSFFAPRPSTIPRQGNDIRVEANKRRRQRYLRDKDLKKKASKECE